MRYTLRIAALLLAVLLPLSAFAGEPKEIVESVVAQMKKQKSPAPILEHVHWPTAYNSFPADERQAMGVNSPEELKKHMTEVMKNPRAFIEKQMKTRLAGMPAQERAMVQQGMTAMLSGIDTQMQDMKNKIGRAEYQVGNEQISGNNAQVDLRATLDGDVKNTTIEMRKIEGQWYFPTIDFAQQNSVKGMG